MLTPVEIAGDHAGAQAIAYGAMFGTAALCVVFAVTGLWRRVRRARRGASSERVFKNGDATHLEMEDVEKASPSFDRVFGAVDAFNADLERLAEKGKYMTPKDFSAAISTLPSLRAAMNALPPDAPNPFEPFFGPKKLGLRLFDTMDLPPEYASRNACANRSASGRIGVRRSTQQSSSPVFSLWLVKMSCFCLSRQSALGGRKRPSGTHSESSRTHLQR